MMKHCNIYKIIQCPRNIITRSVQSSGLNIEKIEQESNEIDGKFSPAISIRNSTYFYNFTVYDEEQKLKEQLLEAKRNKSRLEPQHRNILQDRTPFEEPRYWTHGTLQYNRKLYGKYGQSSGFNPALCWPTNEELTEKIEYEKIAYPFTIPDMIATSKQARQKKNEERKLRDTQIIENMKKLDTAIKDMKTRIAKKEAEANAAKVI